MRGVESVAGDDEARSRGLRADGALVLALDSNLPYPIL
jgi:hypothetical protein